MNLGFWWLPIITIVVLDVLLWLLLRLLLLLLLGAIFGLHTKLCGIFRDGLPVVVVIMQQRILRFHISGRQGRRHWKPGLSIMIIRAAIILCALGNPVAVVGGGCRKGVC